MTGVGNRECRVAATRSGAGESLARRVVVFFALTLLLAVPVFAHGCHAGDHDDEPLFVPRSETAEPVR